MFENIFKGFSFIKERFRLITKNEINSVSLPSFSIVMSFKTFPLLFFVLKSVPASFNDALFPALLGPNNTTMSFLSIAILELSLN